MAILWVVSFATFFSGFVAPFPWDLVLITLGYGLFGGYPLVMQFIGLIRARLFSVIKTTFVGREDPETHRTGWPSSPVQVWTKADPRSDWVGNMMYRDGSVGCYQTVIPIARRGPRHPLYNGRARMTQLIVYYKVPYSVFMKMTDGHVNYDGADVEIRNVGWMLLEEIQPEVRKVRLLREGKQIPVEMRNHIPYTDQYGYHHAAFWLRDACGLPDYEAKVRARAAPTVQHSIASAEMTAR